MSVEFNNLTCSIVIDRFANLNNLDLFLLV